MSAHDPISDIDLAEEWSLLEAGATVEIARQSCHEPSDIVQDFMVAEEKMCVVISVLLEIDLVRIIAFAERADSIEKRTSSL